MGQGGYIVIKIRQMAFPCNTPNAPFLVLLLLFSTYISTNKQHHTLSIDLLPYPHYYYPLLMLGGQGVFSAGTKVRSARQGESRRGVEGGGGVVQAAGREGNN